MARWRALHEIASVAGVLADGDDQLARRYLLHGNVESLDAAIEYAQRAADLGLKPLGEDTLPDLQGKVAELCDEFGPQFRKLRGWAVPPFKSPPSIRGLEEAAGLDRSRPYYKMASYSIHAGPRGFTFDLGLMGRDNRMLAGPSNAGLADPGSRTCIALSQVSGHLISGSGRQTTTGDMVTVQTVLALSRRACAALLAAHRELAAQDREECSDEK
jgi:hypothetical protein